MVANNTIIKRLIKECCRSLSYNDEETVTNLTSVADNQVTLYAQWELITVAVYNKHCNVYIEGFGLVSSFDLSDDYKGGYISLASTNAATSSNQYGFTYLEIPQSGIFRIQL